ncbi:MAG TPA: (Fe-S)-binding protein [Ilumatobacteraceae bacterium]|nr:(Fe-S)-binding protein [Ilumatobacteraceae bacterium]
MTLGLDPDELASCVSCGLCLPHCPTYRVTGEEGLSPRGRIAALRAVQDDGAPVNAEFIEFVETCVQCRGCETACPSGVPYGHLIEDTRTALASQGRITPRWQRLAFRVLGHHRLLVAGSSLLAVAQRVRLVPRRLGLSRLSIRRGPLAKPTGHDVYLYPGCVMDAWMRDTHRSTATVLSATETTFAYPTAGGCCGALHVHAGLHAQAADLAMRTIESMPGDAPVVVNSAGCGAAMKDYARLLGTPQAAAFAARVVDVNEFVAGRLDRLPVRHRERTVVVQDPCHLRHVQRCHDTVRSVLGGVANVVELDDEGLCCGAGGAFSALQPEMANQIRQRKAAALNRAGATPDGDVVVASANPGCAMHLAAAGFTVRHPMELVAEAITGEQR